MSTANYLMMEDFPLYARDEYDEMDLLADEGEASFEWAAESLRWLCEDMRGDVEDLDGGLLFHRVSRRGGYYCGVQLYVDTVHDVREYDNSDCRYGWDMCRSEALRRFESERNRIRRCLRGLAASYGFAELSVAARFSNGETWYSKEPLAA